MAARETPAEQIERLLRSGDLPGAARVAGEMIQKLPTSPVARLGRCRAYLQMGMFLEAEQDLDVALRSAPRDELANYLRGQLDIRTGKDAEGIARLKPIALGRGTCALEAMFAVLDICFHSNRRDERHDPRVSRRRASTTRRASTAPPSRPPARRTPSPATTSTSTCT